MAWTKSNLPRNINFWDSIGTLIWSSLSWIRSRSWWSVFGQQNLKLQMFIWSFGLISPVMLLLPLLLHAKKYEWDSIISHPGATLFQKWLDDAENSWLHRHQTLLLLNCEQESELNLSPWFWRCLERSLLCSGLSVCRNWRWLHNKSWSFKEQSFTLDAYDHTHADLNWLLHSFQSV